jgi:hypothetical protein
MLEKENPPKKPKNHKIAIKKRKQKNQAQTIQPIIQSKKNQRKNSN